MENNIIIVEAPNETDLKGLKIFIAGGITNCPDWQKDLITRLKNDEKIIEQLEDDLKIIIFNPRRTIRPQKNETKKQITWEFFKIKDSDIVSFWFSEGSLNPIVLLEYGRIIASSDRIHKQIVVGCHEKYMRGEDVIIQTELTESQHTYHPKIEVHLDFESFYQELVEVICGRLVQLNFRRWKLSGL